MTTVYTTRRSKVYHSKLSCAANVGTRLAALKMDVDEAEREDKRPCKNCEPMSGNGGDEQ